MSHGREQCTDATDMLQALLAVLQLLATGFFGVLASTLVVLAVLRWRRKRPYFTLVVMSVVSAALASVIWSYDIFTAETTDRQKAAEAFHSNFGFYPPSSVRDIKVKNIAIYDAVGHYMSFTHEDWVFADVLAHDSPLLTAPANSPEFKAIEADYEKDANRPEWAVLPAGRTQVIHYKKDFLRHSSSDYYLWVDTVGNMVHLRVSYFD